LVKESELKMEKALKKAKSVEEFWEMTGPIYIIDTGELEKIGKCIRRRRSKGGKNKRRKV